MHPLQLGVYSDLISGTPHALTQTLELAILFRERGCWVKLSHTTTEEGHISPLMNQSNNRLFHS